MLSPFDAATFVPLITQFTIDDLMRGSLNGARVSDPVVPVRTTRRPRRFR